MSESALSALLGIPESSAHFRQALTHPTYANELREPADNQRLEFLGDSVLGLCVSEILWRRFPNAAEGELTRLRAGLVNADALAEFAREHGVAPALLLGKGAEGNGLRLSKNVLADAVEALVAAVYLDASLVAASQVCERIVDFGLTGGTSQRAGDPKTELQERVQADGAGTPTYELLETGGPAHERWFRVQVRIGGIATAEGRGSSKRSAERAAAAAALAVLSTDASSGNPNRAETEPAPPPTSGEPA